MSKVQVLFSGALIHCLENIVEWVTSTLFSYKKELIYNTFNPNWHLLLIVPDLRLETKPRDQKILKFILKLIYSSGIQDVI